MILGGGGSSPKTAIGGEKHNIQHLAHVNLVKHKQIVTDNLDAEQQLREAINKQTICICHP